MRFAIIGAGNVGTALAVASRRAGHTVTLSASDPASARSTAEKTDCLAAPSNREAVQDADVVFLAVPFQTVPSLLDELGETLNGKIVVDVTNRRDPANPGATLDGSSVAEQIQARVPGARVVKAFNTVFASNQAEPVVDGMPLDGFVAGDDADAKRVILDLMQKVGYRPLDVGPLAMARALEGLAQINIFLNMNNGWSWRTGWKLIGPTK